MTTLEHFSEYLRDALDHLYDPDQLRRSRLLELFDLQSHTDPPAALQDILGKSIEALEPADTVPAQARAWRLYELLICRYLQQLSVHEVADQLGISRRHLQREQNAALETLSHRLWKQFDLEAQAGENVAGSSLEGLDGKSALVSNHNQQYRIQADEYFNTTFPTTMDEELDWLRNLPAEPSPTLEDLLVSVIELVSLLATRNQVAITSACSPGLATPAVHPMAIRQLLLNLLTFAIENVPGSHLTLTVEPEEWNIRIGLTGEQKDLQTKFPSPEHLEILSGVQKLVNLIGARLSIESRPDAFRAVVILPALEQLPILVIDDNIDMTTLLQRYTRGTRYRVIGEQEPGNAVHIAEQVAPQVVLLDVMMPEIDGWEILGRLRQNPRTRHIPIIVCSIMAMEGLALSLGANALLQKPFTQSQFLAALDAQIASLATKSRQ